LPEETAEEIGDVPPEEIEGTYHDFFVYVHVATTAGGDNSGDNSGTPTSVSAELKL
jgi:hypothetical protein